MNVHVAIQEYSLRNRRSLNGGNGCYTQGILLAQAGLVFRPEDEDFLILGSFLQNNP